MATGYSTAKNWPNGLASRGASKVSKQLLTYKERYAPERTVLVDFDGTLCPFSWPSIPGEPYPGAVTALKRFKKQGLIIAIFTARAWSGWDEVVSQEGYRAMKLEETATWLNKHGVPWDYITAEKIPALFILDDRAIRVDGWTDWEEVITEVLEEAKNGQYGRHRRERD